MDIGRAALLAGIAGITIFIGLPVGRIRSLAPGARVVLSAAAVGILIFLVWDVLAHAWSPIDTALTAHHPATVAVDGAVFVVGLAVGLVGLAVLERRMRGAGGQASPRHLALLIAAGIGVHNFAEGLAIGQSAAAGELALAVVLVIGFALHNATEGFGIVAPMAGTEAPGWGYLALLGLIGGGPTFLGGIVGSVVVSDILSVLFLTVAAGSIVYVIFQIVGGLVRMARPRSLAVGTLVGIIAGFGTDAILIAAGA